MKIYFTTPDNDDGYHLGVANWPCVPRVGEYVKLHGVTVNQESTIDKQHTQDDLVFIVDAVEYEGDMNGEQLDRGDPGVTVTLVLPPNDRVWEGAVLP